MARALHENTNGVILDAPLNNEAQTSATAILNNQESVFDTSTRSQNTMILKSCCEISDTDGITKSFQDW